MSDDLGVHAGPFQIHPMDVAFYAHTGACLLEWGDIDTILLNICTAALGANEEIAMVVYGRTPTLESRLSLVTDLLCVRLSKKIW